MLYKNTNKGIILLFLDGRKCGDYSIYLKETTNLFFEINGKISIAHLSQDYFWGVTFEDLKENGRIQFHQ